MTDVEKIPSFYVWSSMYLVLRVKIPLWSPHPHASLLIFNLHLPISSRFSPLWKWLVINILILLSNFYLFKLNKMAKDSAYKPKVSSDIFCFMLLSMKDSLKMGCFQLDCVASPTFISAEIRLLFLRIFSKLTIMLIRKLKLEILQQEGGIW